MSIKRFFKDTGGALALSAALIAPPAVGFGVVASDFGRMIMTTFEMQDAADAAALAAAAELDGSEDAIARATLAAREALSNDDDRAPFAETLTVRFYGGADNQGAGRATTDGRDARFAKVEVVAPQIDFLLASWLNPAGNTEVGTSMMFTDALARRPVVFDCNPAVFLRCEASKSARDGTEREFLID